MITIVMALVFYSSDMKLDLLIKGFAFVFSS